jgi:hypothetical protein
VSATFLVVALRPDGSARYFTVSVPDGEEETARECAEDLMDDDTLVDVMNEDEARNVVEGAFASRPDYVTGGAS